MDANRKTVAVKIAGRAVDMYKPTQDQIVGLSLFESPHLPTGAKIKILTNLFMTLLPTEEDRVWFAEQMVGGDYSTDDLVQTISAIATAKDVPAPAKKTARAKRV
jgi:hypothetical protein